MNKIDIQYFKTSYGELILGSYEKRLCLCDWRYRKQRSTVDDRIKKGLNLEYIENDNQIFEVTRVQLTEYFNYQRKDFDIPLLLVGSKFQKKVWNALTKIPFGTTTSYSALAEKIDNEKAVRAVASANGANAISIIIPCHRVIGLKGNLAGYAGGLSAKKKLLDLEQDLFN